MPGFCGLGLRWGRRSRLVAGGGKPGMLRGSKLFCHVFSHKWIKWMEFNSKIKHHACGFIATVPHSQNLSEISMVFFCYQALGVSVGFFFFRKGGVCFSGFLRFHQPLTAGDHCLGLKCFVRDQCKPVSILEPQQLNVSSERCEREWCETWKKRWIFALNMAVFWSFLVKSHRWPRLHYLPWIGYTTDCKNLPGMDHSKHSQLGFSQWGFPHYRNGGHA